MLRLINQQLDEEAADSNCKTSDEIKSPPRLEETSLSFDCALLCAVTDRTFGPPMNPAQICLRLASHEDVPFLLELRRQTMHPHPWLPPVLSHYWKRICAGQSLHDFSTSPVRETVN